MLKSLRNLGRQAASTSVRAAAVAAAVAAAAPAAGQPPEEAPAAPIQELYLVGCPTAGILPHGGYLFAGAIGPSSSLLFRVSIGFWDRLQLGSSFGLQEFIGRGEIELNDRPGFEVRLRVINETATNPGVALGVDTQGEGMYREEDERYDRKSKGIYAVVSKNYQLLREISLHAGASYSFENRDEKEPSAFGGVSIGIVRPASILLVYDAAIDDNDEDVATCRTNRKGYLDLGIRVDYRENLIFRVLFRDLLNNYARESGVARSFEVFYVGRF